MSESAARGEPLRMLPPLAPPSEFFWTSGRDGRLRILRCAACRQYVHPPAPVCSACRSRDLAPEAVSGRGRVFSFTVNHQRWVPSDPAEAYVVAIVELPEQPALRLITNLVGCAAQAARIGMLVEAVFEQRGEVWIPLFRPAGGAA